MDLRNVADIVTAKNKIIYVAGEYYYYTQDYYKWHHLEQIKAIIISEIDIINQDIKKKRDQVATTTAAIAQILHYINIACYCGPEDINAQNYLNINNGIIDPIQCKLIPHTPDILSTIRINVNFTKEEKCERWLQFLQEVFEGDKYKINILQEYFGLCLTKIQSFEKILLMYGDGANGKSVIMSVLRKLLGEGNVSAVPIEFLLKPNYLAILYNKLVNISPELPAKSNICDSVIKMITSGDTIEADKKFKDPFSFKPFCKMIISTNNLPYISDRSPAFYRRLIILEFSRVFEEHEQDRNLVDKLSQELSGIFIWSIAGLLRLIERGQFELSQEMQQLILDYKQENNPILQYADDTLEHVTMQHIALKEVYDSYKDYCQENSLNPLSKIKFTKELLRQVPYITKTRAHGGWYLQNVKIKSNTVPAEDMGVEL